MTKLFTGGCQCGSLRYQAKALGRASICHCRMCQKAFGNYFAPLVEADGFEWVRGQRSLFASSNLSNRGFCANCGTPITLETDEVVELAIATLDDPSIVKIEYHANTEDRQDAVLQLDQIPEAKPEQKLENNAWNSKIISYQHPDRITDTWEVKR